jgi:hypothetical protein
MSNLLILFFSFLETQFPASAGFFVWLFNLLSPMFPVPTPAQARAAMKADLTAKKATAIALTQAQLKAYLDSDFAALEAKLASHPFLLAVTDGLQGMTDSALLPIFWQFLVTEGVVNP